MHPAIPVLTLFEHKSRGTSAARASRPAAGTDPGVYHYEEKCPLCVIFLYFRTDPMHMQVQEGRHHACWVCSIPMFLVARMCYTVLLLEWLNRIAHQLKKAGL